MRAKGLVLPRELRELVARHEWHTAKALLEKAVARTKGLRRFQYLLHLAHVSRGNGKIGEARGALRSALRHIALGNFVPAATHWVALAGQFEQCGMLVKAKQALERIDDPRAREPSAQIMHERLTTAVERQRSLRAPVKIVAVGQNCFPDNLAMRWGFGPLRVEGPFRAGVFWGDGPAKAIEDNFAKMRERDAFKLDRTASGVLSASLPAYRTIFNHEVGEAWLDDGLTRLRSLYELRIANFHSAMSTDRLLFVFARISSASLSRLIDAIDKVAPTERKRVLVLDFLSRSGDPEPLTGKVPVRILPASFPFQEYVWFNPQHFNTEAGLALEKPIAATLAQEIEALRG